MFLLLADGFTSETLANWVLSGMGIAITALAGWLGVILKPHLESTLEIKRNRYKAELAALSSIPSLVEACQESSTAIGKVAKELTLRYDQMAAAVDVISAIMNANALNCSQKRELILLIEDSDLCAEAVRTILMELTYKYDFTYKRVSQLRFGIQEISKTLIAIVDMTLPETSHDEVMQFLKCSGALEVVVYSAGDWEGELPRHVHFVKKPAIDELKSVLESCLIRTFRHGAN